MKKAIASGIASLLLAAGLVAASTLPASAHTPEVIATCDSLTVTASYYETKPAQGEETIPNPAYQPGTPGSPAVGEPTIPNPEYVAAWTETVEHPPVYEWVVIALDYKKHWGVWPLDWWEHKWFPVDAKPNPNSGWIETGNTKVERVTVTEGWTETINHPAQGEETIPNPAYVPAVPPTDPVGEPTISNPDYQSADATPNTVEIIVDGVSGGVVEFGVGGEWVVPLAGTGHAYEVRFVAWNDADGSKGWTKTFNGTTENCAGVQPEDEQEVGEWVTGEYDCGDTTVSETRSTDHYTYVLEGREWVRTFVEQTTETRERDLTAEEIEALDCPVVTPEPEPTEEPEPTPEPTTAAPIPTPAATPSGLAVTGGETPLPWIGGGIMALLLGALGLTVAARRR